MTLDQAADNPAFLPSLDAFLDQEHQALDRILADVDFLSGHGSFVQAARRFGEFRRNLEKHLGTENTILLSLFVEQRGDPGGLSPKLRLEHDRLRELLGGVAESISRWDHSRSRDLLG